jgi:hypothetical protein
MGDEIVAKATSKLADMDKLYTHKQVMEKLGIGPATLVNLVDKGVITRVIPPGRKTGFYIREDVDEYYAKMNLFAKTYTSRKQQHYEIRLALPEDLPGIVTLHQKLFGEAGSVKLAKQQTWHDKNPSIDIVAVLGDDVVGHIELMPLKDAALQGMLQGTLRGWEVQAEDIETYDEEKQYNIFVMFLGIDKSEDTSDQRWDAANLMREGERFMNEMAERGRIVRGLYATSRTRDGIFMLERMEFSQIAEFSNAKRKAYCIDMGTSKSAIARDYREYLHTLKLPKKLTQGIL